MSRLGVVWRTLNLPCREICRLGSEALDRDLGRVERLALRSHRLYCRACHRYLRQIGGLRRTLGGIAARDGPDRDLPGLGLPDDVRERIKRALKEP